MSDTPRSSEATPESSILDAIRWVPAEDCCRVPFEDRAQIIVLREEIEALLRVREAATRAPEDVYVARDGHEQELLTKYRQFVAGNLPCVTLDHGLLLSYAEAARRVPPAVAPDVSEEFTNLVDLFAAAVEERVMAECDPSYVAYGRYGEKTDVEKRVRARLLASGPVPQSATQRAGDSE